MEDKIKGSLLAGALGDALGYKIEFYNWFKIQLLYGEHGIQELPLTGNKAIFSDDTQMTLFTCEGMIHALENNDNLVTSLHDSYLNWLTSQGIRNERYSFAKHRNCQVETKVKSKLLSVPELRIQRAPGNTCISSLCSGRIGTIENYINDSKGCGGVMRVAPIGFTDKFGNPLVAGAKAAAITHGNPGGFIPAGMLSDIIYKIHSTKKNLRTIIEDAFQDTLKAWNTAYIKDFQILIEDAFDMADNNPNETPAIHYLGEGWVGDEALAIAIYAVLRHPDDIKKALICAVNHRGDSDSTGSIAGNILGAYLGYDALPKDWLEKLELKDVISNTAHRLTQAIEVTRNG